MRIRFQKSFNKQFVKLSKIQKQHTKDTIELFSSDPHDKSLRNHPLKDKWLGYRSVSADDDLRLHYKELSDNTILFVAVGSHDELYK